MTFRVIPPQLTKQESKGVWEHAFTKDCGREFSGACGRNIICRGLYLGRMIG
jgi:hypothetical protein